MYNRECFIARAINSCLYQHFDNFELIVVDDGSTDKSCEIVKNYFDPRITLISHKINRGVGPARNTGVSVAKGDWVIFLDSDDELLQESLSLIYKRCTEVAYDISRLYFMGQIDTGELSPNPPLKNELIDYIKYIKWMESCYGRLQDAMPVVKRNTFKYIRFYDGRTLECPYHLDFMKQFFAWSFSDVVALYHQDANNQLTKPNIHRTLQGAHDQSISEELLLQTHGEALKIHAPRVYRQHISGMATLFFLCGDRQKGIKFCLQSFKCNFFSIRSWIILLFGLIGPKHLAWLKNFRTRLYQMNIWK